MRRRHSRRLQALGGFSQVEMLVVLGVVSLLMSIALPAIQAARESARALQCRNNLHQIGLAAHSFHEQYGYLETRHQMFRSLLPHVEHVALFAQMEQQREDQLNGVRRDLSQWKSPALYLCPSDSIVDSARLHLSYGVNCGGRLGRSTGVVRDDGNEVFRFREACDGLSNSAFVSERLVALPDVGLLTEEEGRLSPLRYFWKADSDFRPGQESEFWQYCVSQHARNSAVRGGRYGNHLALWGHETTYDHILPPNAWTFSVLGSAGRNPGSFPPSSLHQGGVFVLLLDGSVMEVSDFIAREVYQAIGTIAAND